MPPKMNKDTGYYELEFQLLGERVHQSCKTGDLEQAKKIEATIRKAIVDGTWNFQSQYEKISFKDISKTFLKYSENHKKSFKDDEYFCKKFDNFYGAKFVKDIKPSDIEAYFTKRLKENVKNSTINREFDSLRKLFQLAVNDRIITENPCSKVKKLRVDNIQIRYLTKQEEKDLFKQIGNHWIKPIIIMALKTGMRKGEMLSLKWVSVNFSKGYIDVLQSKTGKARKIPLAPKLAKELLKVKKIGEYVFTNPDTKLPYEDVRQFEDFIKDSGIVKFRFHDLRHTFATRCIEKKTDIVVLATLLGHRNIQTTMRYAHPVPEMMLKAILQIDKY